MYRYCFVFLLACFSFWFPSAFKRWTHPFRPAKCLIQCPYIPEWEISPLSVNEKQKIYAVLKEPFSYLSKGAQSYVFLSQDQKYVLKLFRFDTCRMPFGQNILKKFRKWARLKEKLFLPTEVKIMKNFSSCKLAYSLAQKQTGVVFVHLNPKPDFLPILRVKDRLGRCHRIDPAHYRFALQKKADRFKEILTVDDARPYIMSYLTLLKEIAELGLVNIDVKLGSNFGFLEGKAIQIDFGNFIYCPAQAMAQRDYFVSRLQTWLENHSLKICGAPSDFVNLDNHGSFNLWPSKLQLHP